MNKILVLVLLLSKLIFANEEFTKEEYSVFDKSTQKQENEIKTNTQTENRIITKNLYLSYLNYPKIVYKNQRFEIDVKALITRKNFNKIETSFADGINMLPLNAQTPWKLIKNTKNLYKNKYYFKAYESKFLLPTIEVKLYNNDILVESRKLLPPKISFSQIARADKKFSNIIAKEITLLNSKAKQYTNKEALVIMDLQGNYSNLEDFNIKGFEEQGVTLIEDNYPEQHLIYYLVIPIHQKNISFNYYNSDKNILQKINVPIKFEEELVSTQTDLNPNNSSFEFYKKIAIVGIALVFLILFIIKRNYIYLIIFLIFAIVFLLFAMPNTSKRLKENSVIYILPTKNSTVFQKVQTSIVVEEMKRKNNFMKIMFKKDGQKYIGWVKEEDVIKN